MRAWLVRRYGMVSAVLGAAGIALILISEIASVDWLRIFGALLISTGGVGVGVWFGLASSRRWPLQAALRQGRRWIAILAAIMLSTPVVVALVAALAALLDEEGRQARDATVLVGGVVAIVLVVAVLVALGLGIRSINRAARDERATADVATGPTA